MKVLTILGPSSSLLEDINTHGIEGDVMAVNRAIIDYTGKLKFAVCLNPKILRSYLHHRKLLHLNVYDVVTYTNSYSFELPINTSGLLALCVAAQHDYDLIRVLGISADNSGHYYDFPGASSQNYEELFPFDNKEWYPLFEIWKDKFKIASGKLLKLFSKL